VKCRRVKIRPIRPNQGMNLWINLHLFEKILILQWPEQFTCQNRAKIDGLLFAISKHDPQGVGGDNLKLYDAMMLNTRFGEHSDDDAKETTDFGQALILQSSLRG